MVRKAFYVGFSAILVAVLSALPARPASALTYAEETIVCPLDGRSFTYQAVASYSQFGMQLDLKPIGALVAPIPLPVCPASGFVMYRDDFSDQDIAFFRDVVEGAEYRTIRAANSDYFVAAWQAGKLGEDAFEVAFLSLQASWEVDGEPEKYERYARIALSRFREYDKSRAAENLSEKWWAAKLLIVNLHRRLGEFDPAGTQLAELPTADQPADSGYRVVGDRLKELIAKKDSAAAEIVPRRR